MRDEMAELRTIVQRLESEVAGLRQELAVHKRQNPHPYRPHAQEHANSDWVTLNFMQTLNGIPTIFPNNRIFYDTSTNKLTVRVNGVTRVSGVFS